MQTWHCIKPVVYGRKPFEVGDILKIDDRAPIVPEIANNFSREPQAEWQKEKVPEENLGLGLAEEFPDMLKKVEADAFKNKSTEGAGEELKSTEIPEVVEHTDPIKKRGNPNWRKK